MGARAGTPHALCLEGGREGGREAYTCSEVQYIIDNSHMGTPPEQNDRQTPFKTLPSRNLVGGW